MPFRTQRNSNVGHAKMDRWTNVKDWVNIKRAGSILLVKLNGEVDMGRPAESPWDASKPTPVRIIKNKIL